MIYLHRVLCTTRKDLAEMLQKASALARGSAAVGAPGRCCHSPNCPQTVTVEQLYVKASNHSPSLAVTPVSPGPSRDLPSPKKAARGYTLCLLLLPRLLTALICITS